MQPMYILKVIWDLCKNTNSNGNVSGPMYVYHGSVMGPMYIKKVSFYVKKCSCQVYFDYEVEILIQSNFHTSNLKFVRAIYVW